MSKFELIVSEFINADPATIVTEYLSPNIDEQKEFMKKFLMKNLRDLMIFKLLRSAGGVMYIKEYPQGVLVKTFVDYPIEDFKETNVMLDKRLFWNYISKHDKNVSRHLIMMEEKAKKSREKFESVRRFASTLIRDQSGRVEPKDMLRYYNDRRNTHNDPPVTAQYLGRKLNKLISQEELPKRIHRFYGGVKLPVYEPPHT